MNMIILILLMGLVTYIPRFLPFLLMDRLKCSKKVQKFLALIPYSAMASLIFPGVLSVDPKYVWIGGIGFCVAFLCSLIKKMPVALTVILSVLVLMLIYAIM